MARKRFLDQMANEIPLANQALRVEELARAAQAFKPRGAWMQMCVPIEKISAELGVLNTSRRAPPG